MAITAPNEIEIAGRIAPSSVVIAFLPQLSRYSIVSVIALATDFTVYLTLCATAVNASAAGIAGYAVGMIAHYTLSSRFVFDAARSEKSASRRLAEFVVSGLLGLVLTGAVIAGLTEYLAASPLVAKAAAVIVSFFAVFLVRRWIVFAPLPEGKKQASGFVYSKSGSCH